MSPFLGFTHICGETRSGKFTVLRKTIRKKLTAKLKEVRAELGHRMHEPVPTQGAYLRSVVSGHIRYFGVPLNGPGIGAFHKEVCWMWMKVLRRRSQKHNLRWERMKRLIAKWLPPARVCHPYPEVRFGVIT
jgi:RNA-directed DNA polymerase